MLSVEIKPETTEAFESWAGVIDLANVVPQGWALCGGQVAFLYTQLAGIDVVRPSDDADIVIDVRAYPNSSEVVFKGLKEIGFQSAGYDMEGRQHCWLRGRARIDVLQPRYLGERKEQALRRLKLHTIEAPGSQHLLDRTHLVKITVGNRVGKVRTPTILGATVAKAAAFSEIVNDPNKLRHIADLLTLAPLVSRQMVSHEPPLNNLESRRVAHAAAWAQAHRSEIESLYGFTDLEQSIYLLRMLVRDSKRSGDGSF